MKRLLQLAIMLGGLSLASCSQAAAPTPATGDMSLGPDNAKVTITEYVAPSCPVCKRFHDEIYKPLKAKYIDTGKVRFVLKEMPSHNPPVDVGVFLLARCAGKEKYFSVIDASFAQQEAIEMAARSPGGAKPALLSLAQSAGGLSEERADACLNDPAGMKRIITAADEEARTKNVTGTPTLFINDERVGPNTFSVEGFSAAIDAKLAAK